jgi:hypothetical protein
MIVQAEHTSSGMIREAAPSEVGPSEGGSTVDGSRVHMVEDLRYKWARTKTGSATSLPFTIQRSQKDNIAVQYHHLQKLLYHTNSIRK